MRTFNQNLPLSFFCFTRVRCQSSISFCNSLFLVSFVSVASSRCSCAIRAAANSGRLDFFGFSNRVYILLVKSRGSWRVGYLKQGDKGADGKGLFVSS